MQIFSARDNARYNQYSINTTKEIDVNDLYDDEITRTLKNKNIQDIPEELTLAVEKFKKSVEEYLRKVIKYRQQAPGSFNVGPANYNMSRHNKVMAQEQRNIENLNEARRRLYIEIDKYNKANYRKAIEEATPAEDWEKSVKPGDAVIARWTNSGNVYSANAEIKKINLRNYNVELLEDIRGGNGDIIYPKGQKIQVQRYTSDLHSANNRITQF